jgi:hypothetical protein
MPFRRTLQGLIMVLMFAAAPLLATPAVAAPGGVLLRKQTTPEDFAGSTLRGVRVERDGDRARLTLDPGRLTLGRSKLYGPPRYWYGTLESPALDAPAFDRLVPSWNADTPPGTWMQIEVRAIRPADRRWTRYYNLGIWASGSATIARRSIDGQNDSRASVATDTLRLKAGGYTRYQYRLTLFTTDRAVSPAVRLVAVLTDDSRAPANDSQEPQRAAWGIDLAVPQRSQMIYPGGGEVWCSPTSTSMVLAFWGHNVAVPDAAAATYDRAYDGNGNWPFNTAFAASYGLESYVTRMRSLAQVEQWIAAGVPVIISIAVEPGELPGAPYTRSSGHIIVVRGFTENGNVIVNEPYFGSDDTVRTVYDRAALERVWLGHSRGTVYLIYPVGHAVPQDGSNGSW